MVVLMQEPKHLAVLVVAGLLAQQAAVMALMVQLVQAEVEAVVFLPVTLILLQAATAALAS